MIYKIISIFTRKPDVIIGDEKDPYLYRWHIIPRNKWFNIYLHKFLKSDDDRALHDHPWTSLSLLFKGEYNEFTPKGMKYFKAPSLIPRRAKHTHRIELINNKPTWTLFITGPKIRDWYFHCPQGLVHWSNYVEATNDGQKIGKGCNQ